LNLLIDAGADVNAKEHEGVTALIMTAETQRQACANKLLESGANVNAQSANLMTSLMVAAYQGNLPLLKLLLDRGADMEIRGNQGKILM
jgi:ankyrin repeat protein